MVKQDLLDILACPKCKTSVVLVRESWLVCQNPDCHRKYPIIDDIPAMLIDEGDKYRDISVDQLTSPDETSQR